MMRGTNHKSEVHSKEPYMHFKKPTFTLERALYTLKRALYTKDLKITHDNVGVFMRVTAHRVTETCLHHAATLCNTLQRNCNTMQHLSTLWYMHIRIYITYICIYTYRYRYLYTYK